MTKRKPKTKSRNPVAFIDATPERIAQAGNDNQMILAMPGERLSKVRRFRDAAVDRMYRAKRINYAAWYAADWYRGVYEQSGITHRVTANLNPSGGGECTYGMPTTERQARCRAKLRTAREIIGVQMVSLIDNLLLHDLSPAFRNGRQRERYGDMIGRALQPLAEWLAAPVHE